MPQEFFTYLISLDWISDSCYNKTADILGFHLDICYLRTSSITPNCQINQWSWIQLNTKCAPQEFLAYLISLNWISDSCYNKTADNFGFSPWYMLIKNLQHYSKLSNKPMKLNSAKYKMRAPRISYLSNKYRFDFWQLLHPYSWFFWGFHLDLCYMETPSITSSCQITNEVEFS